MKANMIIGKRQIILASLVVILGIAIFLNWQFANTDKNYDLTAKLEEDTVSTTAGVQPTAEVADTDAEVPTETITKEEGETKHLGDAELVDSKSVSADDYFAKAKMTKLKSRDEAIQTISTILNDEKVSEADKTTATQQAVDLSQSIETESKLENLIKSKGFEECMVYLNGNGANVIVKSDALTSTLATQIKDIVLTEGNILAEKISIVELQ